MITVHHLENSRSQRVLWLLEELGLPYQVKRYARERGTSLAPASLRAVHPLGKSPVIADGGIVVAESGAIVEYLVECAGGAALIPPPGSEERRRYTYWLHFAEGSAMTPLVLKLVFERVRRAPMPFFVRPVARAIADKVEASFIAPNLAAQLGFMEAELASHEWFAGEDFTAADVQMSFPVEAAQAAGLLGASHPRLSYWLERVHARPAYRRALERGGPYAPPS